MIVADANLMVYLYINGAQMPLVQEVHAKDPRWIVPPLWQSEFRNVLSGYIRRGMAPYKAKQILKDALNALEPHQVAPSSDPMLDLITESDCTAYDCEFLALARQLDVPPVTADKQLPIHIPSLATSLELFAK